MALKMLIYILFVIVILLCIFSVYEFIHYRNLYIEVTENVSSIFEGFKKEAVALQNMGKQLTEFTSKTHKEIDEFKKEVRGNMKEIETKVKNGGYKG